MIKWPSYWLPPVRFLYRFGEMFMGPISLARGDKLGNCNWIRNAITPELYHWFRTVASYGSRNAVHSPGYSRFSLGTAISLPQGVHSFNSVTLCFPTSYESSSSFPLPLPVLSSRDQIPANQVLADWPIRDQVFLANYWSFYLMEVPEQLRERKIHQQQL